MNKKPTPPKLPIRFFRWFCHRDYLEDIEGDLRERFEILAEEKGTTTAKWEFFREVIQLFRPGIIRSLGANQRLNHYGMFKNYFKVGLRNILKYKVFSFINVFGLAVAMSVCMLIMMMLIDQKSYDRFHENKDRTYRILSKIKGSMTPNATSPFPLATTVKEDYPIIEEATRLIPEVGGDISYGKKATEVRGFFADQSFFKVFGFDPEKGNKNNALDLPNSVVITSELASLLFSDENPIGKSVEFADRGLKLLSFDIGSDTGSAPANWGSFTITGVIDNKKYKSHLKFDVLISATSLPALYQDGKIADFTDNWQRYSYCYTYVMLKPQNDGQDLTALLQDLVDRKYAGFENLEGFKLISQPLKNITPGIFVGRPASLRLPIEAYYFLGFLALVIMVSACLNYTNLSVARALTRVKEIGVRKVNGANRKNLILQFLSESIMTVMFALIMANILLILLKPAFMDLWVNRYLDFDLQGNIFAYIIFLGFALLTSLVAGTYPALYLSGFSPARVLKNLNPLRSGKVGVRKILSTFQFVLSLFFIITSILIARQFRHFVEFDYGFNTGNIVNIPMQGNDYQLLSNQFGTVPGVLAISACEFIPATAGGNGVGVRKTDSTGDYKRFESIRVDSNFINTLGLDIIAGRNLPGPGQSDHLVLVNEAAVKAMGYRFPAEMIGQTLEAQTHDKPLEVVGVVEDFKFQTPVMEDKIGPLIFRSQPKHFSFINVKIAGDDIAGVLTKLGDKWKELDSMHPFRYRFFDDQLADANQWIGDIAAIIGFIAFLAITIACLGMLGMATYTTERKRKEVGIRKVLGAQYLNIALLLSKAFLRILLIAIFIGAPLSFMVNNLWLQNFPNRVDFGLDIVLLGMFILFVLGSITIGSQTVLAARRNPVRLLKYE